MDIDIDVKFFVMLIQVYRSSTEHCLLGRALSIYGVNGIEMSEMH